MKTNKQIEKYVIRETIIRTIREFFYCQDFHEIITPLLNRALPLEPNLRPFVTTHEYDGMKETFYLPMSPERGIKKMLALGFGNCFAIDKSFRNYERKGPLHLHEFIMLEWYRKGATHIKIIDDVEQLIKAIDEKLGNILAIRKGVFPHVSLNTLFSELVGESLNTLIEDETLMREIARNKGYKIEKVTTWEELYNQLFVNEIEPTFSSEAFFLVDFPARVSPLCKKHTVNPHFAERFELYIKGIEIANGNTENTDIIAIRNIFEKENKKTGMPIDETFLSSLETMKNDQYAGVGMGIDRLTMMCTDLDIFV